MLDPQVRETLENYARPILHRFNERSERMKDASGRSTLPNLLRQLQFDLPPSPGDVMRKSNVGEMEAWVLSVAWALGNLGPMASRVVLWRLTRRAKSTEGAWRSIAADLEESNHDASIADCKQMYEMGLPILVQVFEQNGITTAYRGPSVRIEANAIGDQCAAMAAGLDCPIANAAA